MPTHNSRPSTPHKTIKVVRVITASYVVPWHLHNTLARISNDFETCVVGDGVSQYQQSYPRIKFVDLPINRKVNVGADFRALVLLYRFFCEYKPDIVHSIMPKAGLLTALAARLAGIPIRLHTFTGQTWVAMTGKSRHFYYLIDWFINKINTMCLTDSPSQSLFLAQHHIKHGERPLAVLSKGSLSGVDMSRYSFETIFPKRTDLRKQLGLSNTDIVFLFLARKTKAKGAIDVLIAFQQLKSRCPSAKLLFVGPDEDGDVAKLRVEHPNYLEDILEVDHVANPEMYVGVADILCLPSYREGFGSIVIDAAAIAVPTIGTRIPGLVDAIEDGETGILIDAGNINALTEAMYHLAQDAELRLRLAHAARQRVEAHFSADILYQSLRDLYHEQLAKQIN